MTVADVIADLRERARLADRLGPDSMVHNSAVADYLRDAAKRLESLVVHDNDEFCVVVTERNELLGAVSQMREAQREYFKTRTYAALDKSKSLERTVDAMVARLRDPQQELGL